MEIMKFRFVISVLLFFLSFPLTAQTLADEESQAAQYQDFAFQTNYNFMAGFNIDPKFENNFFQGKIMIDLAEGFFNRFGISVSLGGEIGYKRPDSTTSSLIASLYTPEIAFSYYIFPQFIASAGLSFTQSWYMTKEVSENTVNTLVYTNGLSLPVKVRYYFTKHIAALASVNFLLHPWISISDENTGKNKTIWDFVTQANLGITISLPSRRL